MEEASPTCVQHIDIIVVSLMEYNKTLHFLTESKKLLTWQIKMALELLCANRNQDQCARRMHYDRWAHSGFKVFLGYKDWNLSPMSFTFHMQSFTLRTELGTGRSL